MFFFEAINGLVNISQEVLPTPIEPIQQEEERKAKEKLMEEARAALLKTKEEHLNRVR